MAMATRTVLTKFAIAQLKIWGTISSASMVNRVGAGEARGIDELALAHAERDRAHLAGGPGPVEEDQDDADQQQGGAALQQSEDIRMRMGKRRHHNEDIGQQSDNAVGDAAEEAGGQPGEDADQRGEEGDEQADEERVLRRV